MFFYRTMIRKRTFFLLVFFVFGTIAKDEMTWRHGKDVVNLTKDIFDQKVAKKPHFVMFYANG